MQKYSDYNSYLTKLKFSKYNIFLKPQQNTPYENNINNIMREIENSKKPQNIYNSLKSNKLDISLDNTNTFILNPIDEQSSFLHTIYNLKAYDIKDGIYKNIINNCHITLNKTIGIYSINNLNIGGFNNLGTNYNYYIFPCKGDSF
jgi:hypothetical protein